MYMFNFPFSSLSVCIFAVRRVSRFPRHAGGPVGILTCCRGVFVRSFNVGVNACFPFPDAAGILAGAGSVCSIRRVIMLQGYLVKKSCAEMTDVLA